MDSGFTESETPTPALFVVGKRLCFNVAAWGDVVLVFIPVILTEFIVVVVVAVCKDVVEIVEVVADVVIVCKDVVGIAEVVVVVVVDVVVVCKDVVEIVEVVVVVIDVVVVCKDVVEIVEVIVDVVVVCKDVVGIVEVVVDVVAVFEEEVAVSVIAGVFKDDVVALFVEVFVEIMFSVVHGWKEAIAVALVVFMEAFVAFVVKVVEVDAMPVTMSTGVVSKAAEVFSGISADTKGVRS